MTKAIVVYESKYGNTRLVAEKIIEGMEEVGGVKAVLNELNEVDLSKVTEYDAILIGSPNHYGGPTKDIEEFIDKLGELNLEEKTFAVFDTHMKGFFEKAVKRMEKRVNEKAPGLERITPGLSIRVQGSKGPILNEELPKCKKFGHNIATQIKV